MNELTNFTPGQRLAGFPGGWARQVNDALQDVQEQVSMGTDEAATAFGRRALTLEVMNDSGQDLGKYAILGFQQLIDPPDEMDTAVGEQEAQEAPLVSGELPDAATHGSQFLITQEPIAAGTLSEPATGQCLVMGVTRARVDVVDESHTTAGVIDSDTGKLRSGLPGAEILWKPSGTGVKWCLVKIGGGSSEGGSLTFGLVLEGGVTGANRYDDATHPPSYDDFFEDHPDGVCYAWGEGFVETLDDSACATGEAEGTLWKNPSRVSIEPFKLVGAISTQFGMMIVWEDCG